MGDSGDDLNRRYRFDELYRDNYPDIFRYVLRRLPADSRADDAADTSAEVFATAWRRLAKIPSPPEDRLWLYGVARRTVNRHVRGRVRRERLTLRLQTHARVTSSGHGPSSLIEERIAAALEKLKPADREVVRLVLWDGLDNSQAARVLGCSANTVAVRLHRARKRLRSQLSESLPPVSTDKSTVSRVTKEI